MLKILFAGTPECAVPVLHAIAQKHHIVGILTRPPAAVGRSKKLIPSAIALATEVLKSEKRISPAAPLFTPQKLNKDVREAIAAVSPDVMVCFAYGKIFGQSMLDLFPLGAINIHPSLLPRWRGSTPVPAAILTGDTKTGVTVQQMALEMDAGDILAQCTIPLDGSETAESLLNLCAQRSADLTLSVLQKITDKTLSPMPQDHSAATFCGMLTKEMGLINWHNSAEEIDRRHRAFVPWPGTFTYKNNEKLSIQALAIATSENTQNAEPGTILTADKKNGILVQTGKGIISLIQLQRTGKKSLYWKDFLNGSAEFLTGKFNASL
ncbi:methionyl-tRNA formyltransferase [Treponema phagedenis]|uniref:methionyl-tRNA formyltransferase n=1 Tax=Treponema phagedenis TaxID=162 RepID=UPI0001F64145|nr:methionyl-tRNA formyltransferase [Treponema phagedenis]EFW37680.1 methionyl-tRNA formyltransferase [Treponema phagedenis F0421]